MVYLILTLGYRFLWSGISIVCCCTTVAAWLLDELGATYTDSLKKSVVLFAESMSSLLHDLLVVALRTVVVSSSWSLGCCMGLLDCCELVIVVGCYEKFSSLQITV